MTIKHSKDYYQGYVEACRGILEWFNDENRKEIYGSLIIDELNLIIDKYFLDGAEDDLCYLFEGEENDNS
jgi:hypothetical protein